MDQTLRAYGPPKETVRVIMMLCKNSKVMVQSPNADTNFFNDVVGILQGKTIVPYLFIIYLDCVTSD